MRMGVSLQMTETVGFITKRGYFTYVVILSIVITFLVTFLISE